MLSISDDPNTPIGTKVQTAARRRAARSEEYRLARDEYAEISDLRKRNWIAAHVRERRFELELTQQEVAERAGTAHSYISRLESGEHLPTIPVLQRILSVLGEELLIGIQRTISGDELERELAPAPQIGSA